MREMKKRKEKIKLRIVQINTMRGDSTENSQEYGSEDIALLISIIDLFGRSLDPGSLPTIEIIHFTCAE